MLRILIIYILPLILPALIYFSWVAYVRYRAALRGVEKPDWSDAPWVWLIGIGVALALTSAGAFALYMGGSPAGSQYVPAHMEDGRLVPGRHVPQ